MLPIPSPTSRRVARVVLVATTAPSSADGGDSRAARAYDSAIGKAGSALDLLVFEIDRATCAIPLPSVEEVCRAVAVLPLPGAPDAVLGVIDLRGRLVPVLDARAHFHLAARDVEPEDTFVIGRARGRAVALVADRVREIASVDVATIESAAALSPSADSVVGIARLPGGLVVIHDLDAFLNAAETGQLDQALASATARREP